MDTEKFLEERILTSKDGNIYGNFDTLVSTVKVLIKQKLKEQRRICAEEIQFKFDDNNNISKVQISSILNASEPEI